MILHNVQQGTSEWLQLRAGIPTASSFDKIITPGGKESRQQEKYLYQLLAERCMGHPVIGATKLWWADRGKELEEHAVRFYELTRNVDTEPIGFVTNNEQTIGASPDRLVGVEGLAEFKCPSEAEHMGYLLQSGSAYEDYKVQVQGQLFICEDRRWVDVVSYHPELPEAVIRIERDEKFIAILRPALSLFVERLEELSFEMVKRGLLTENWRNAA